jgi:hypothetical protein
MWDTLMICEGRGHIDGALDNGILMVPCPIWCVGMRKVGNTQQDLAEFFLKAVCVALQRLFLLSQGSTALHEGLCLVVLLVAAQQSNLLGHIVDAGAKGISFRCDVSEAAVQRDGLVHLSQHIGLPATGKSLPNIGKICAEESYINHRESGYLALL